MESQCVVEIQELSLALTTQGNAARNLVTVFGPNWLPSTLISIRSIAYKFFL